MSLKALTVWAISLRNIISLYSLFDSKPMVAAMSAFSVLPLKFLQANRKESINSSYSCNISSSRSFEKSASSGINQNLRERSRNFYTAFYTAQRAIDAYQKECAKWEEAYGEKATPKVESMHEKLQRYQEKADKHNASQPYRSRDKGAR